MPRTNLKAKDHKKLVELCGGVVPNITQAILGAQVPKKELGNFGIALKIAAIRAHYRVAA